MRNSSGLLLVAGGLLLAAIGLLVWVGALSWFGRLPGDIRIERPGMRFYAPITSMLLLSIVVSLLLAIIRRLR
jgi:hypothetical protein